MARAPGLWLLLPAVLSGALLLACDDSDSNPAEAVSTVEVDPDALPRSFLLGVSSQPVEATEEAYREAFAVAGQLGELVLIQRAPPWEDFLPGGRISPRTERLTLVERQLAKDHGLDLMLAIDPTLPSNRGVLANIPEEASAGGFASEDLRSAFIGYAAYLALNYKPAYLALGVEVDLIFINRGDASFRNFVSLYFEAYDAVKAVSPETQVFPIFQYENLLGILDEGGRQPGWSLVARFQPKIDLLAVSTFPISVFSQHSEVPPDYFDPLHGRFDMPVAFASTGWPSSSNGARDETAQLNFMLRMVAAADRLDSPFLVWFLAQDPTNPEDADGEPISSLGLLAPEGRNKRVMQVWNGQLERPLR